MDKFEIITSPNPILRKKSKKVDALDAETKETIKTMIGALNASKIEGLAIAAPQIGTNKRIVVVRVRETRDEDGRITQKGIPLSVYINPEITKFSKEKSVSEEGCLSCPGLYGPVARAKKIKFEAMDQRGKETKMNAAGLLARIVQHEVDHLDGILFIDKLTDKKKLRKIGANAEDTEK